MRPTTITLVSSVVLALASQSAAQHVIVTAEGPLASELLGRAVDSIGDLTSDGVPDILAGAPFASPNQSQSGYVVVLDGSSGNVVIRVDGAQNGSMLGASVAAAGDVNLDGVLDFIAGSPLVLPPLPFGPPNPPGQAFVYSGLDGATLRTFAAPALGDGFGRSVDGGRDVDQDGSPDLLVGADFGNYVRVFSGATSAQLHLFQGDAAGDFFGYAAALIGDVDGDGRPDVAVGARLDDDNGTDCGMARILSGATGAVVHTFYGDAAGDTLGYSLAHAGDVDLDGRADLIVGIRGDDDGGAEAGAARLFSGGSGAVLHTFHGAAAGDGAGNVNGVDGGFDADGDGRPDLVVAAPQNDTNGNSSGRVTVYSGATFLPIGHADGEIPDFLLGVAVRGGGDYDLDGRDDVVIGAFGDDAVGGANSGHVRVVALCQEAASANYGAGWPGTLGVPALAALSDPEIGSAFTLQIGNSAGVSTNALVFVGAAAAAIPTGYGGTLLLAPLPIPPIAVPVPTPNFTIGVPLPNDGALCGVKVYLQALVFDPGASKGVAFTPGLELTFGK
jgi:hypothetical protein